MLLDKYLLYNNGLITNFDKTIQLINYIENSSYDDVLNYMTKNYGDFKDNVINLDFPECSKKIEVTYDKNDTTLKFELYAQGKPNGTILVSKCCS